MWINEGRYLSWSAPSLQIADFFDRTGGAKAPTDYIYQLKESFKQQDQETKKETKKIIQITVLLLP
jgi:hypothetical protein